MQKTIGPCPCGKCGKNIYDLGNYRGFQIIQRPFFDGWKVKAEKIHEEDVLDQLILNNSEMCVAVLEGNFSVDDLVRSIHNEIDTFWKRKEHIVNMAKQNQLQVLPK